MDRIGPYRVLAVSYLGRRASDRRDRVSDGRRLHAGRRRVLIGFGVAGAQKRLNLVSATLYPTAARVTGVRWAMANGRFGSIVGSMLGAQMMTAAGSAEVFFLWLALPALLGAGAIFLLYRLSLRRAPLAKPVAGAPNSRKKRPNGDVSACTKKGPRALRYSALAEASSVRYRCVHLRERNADV
ncbi:hypothetical protein M8494_26505 [Serratia ureilytica]